jgi:general secretion pathway protein N
MKLVLDFTRPRLPRFFWATLFFLLLGVLCWQLPASWFGGMLASQTGCRVTAQQVMGSIWEGSAALGFSESNGQGSCREPFALTERFSWSSSCSMRALNCQTRVQFSALDQPQVIMWSFAKIALLANEIQLPANVLEALGNPWSTLRPRGALTARWTDLNLAGISPHSQSAQSGVIRIIISNLSSPISPIKPLGSYEILANLDGSNMTWSLSTTSGPLLLKGQGDTKAGLHFEGQAWAAAEAQDSLIGLLVLLGKKEGDVYRLQF